ncbi:MAG: DUF4332 domain-containing protein [Anaerolineales bacterium]|nr:DUF4332 domain-containing protein [Anaerolineales bacterium]
MLSVSTTTFLTIRLAVRLQDGGNVLTGVILVVAALVLLYLFWQWWKSVEGEDSAIDLRTLNAHVNNGEEEAIVAHADPHHEETHAPEHYEMEAAAEETAVAEPEAAPEPEPTEPIEPDDLTKIEGVGPKIAELLQAAGFATYAQLAQAETSTLQKVLEEAGPRYRLADPSTWAQQAGLAAAGQWDELAVLQDNLKGGRAAE